MTRRIRWDDWGHDVRALLYLIGAPVFALAILAACVFAFVMANSAVKQRRIEGLKVQAAPLIEAIEDYFRTHGEYPADLGDAGLSLPDTPRTPWRYRRRGDGFTLSIGDYKSGDFVLTYYPGRGWSSGI